MGASAPAGPPPLGWHLPGVATQQQELDCFDFIEVDPGYLAHNHRYLDAGWAQYVYRKGSAADYISRNVADAKERASRSSPGSTSSWVGPTGRS